MILRMLALVSVLPTDVGRNVHIDHAGERTDAWLRRVWGGVCKEEERNREPRRQCTGRQWKRKDSR